MPRNLWQYTRTETFEIEAPSTVVDEEAFLEWLSNDSGSKAAHVQLVDVFVGEPYKLKQGEYSDD